MNEGEDMVEMGDLVADIDEIFLTRSGMTTSSASRSENWAEKLALQVRYQNMVDIVRICCMWKRGTVETVSCLLMKSGIGHVTHQSPR